MNLREEIEELETVVQEAKVREGEAMEVFELARAYLTDARHFLERGKREEALEAYAIAWAYIDALLHLRLIEIPSRFLRLFTV